MDSLIARAAYIVIQRLYWFPNIRAVKYLEKIPYCHLVVRL